jgi:NADPH2:quinone reductase
VVDKLGDGVTGFKIGDRVAAFSGSGAFAEQIVVGQNRCVHLAESVSFEAAAAATVTYGTTIYGLRERGKLQPGETLLVLGAGGGVGSAAVEVGKLLGATVIAGASSDEKLAVAKQCGADHLINYRTSDLRESLRPFTGKNAIDVIYDPIGGDYSEPAFRSIGWNGRFLVIGFAAGRIPALPMNLALLKSASLVGVFWGASMEHEPDVFKRDIADLYNWLAEGKLKPHIGARYKLAETPQAISDLMNGKATGKLVIEID